MAFSIDLKFDGAMAEDHALDFYDSAQALVGFQRSLAITTHLIVNGEVITQAPSLKNARIISYPAEEGSWKTTAVVMTGLVGGVFTLGTAPRDTPLGHLVSSAYDYVVSEALGFHVDYDKTLGQSIEDYRRAHPDELQGKLREAQIDSVIEKCEAPIREMHRPIVFSETATSGQLLVTHGRVQRPIGPPLTRESFEYIAHTHQTELPEVFEGWVSSYNMNTFKGRIYVGNMGRPIPFTLAEILHAPRKVALVTTSLTANARERLSDDGKRYFTAFRNETTTGRLKSFYIVELTSQPY